MKFTKPATTNPIDQLKVVGKPTDRIDGPLKTTGTAPYAYEQHKAAPNAAYGYVVGAAIAKGRIGKIDTAAARAAPGVIAVVTHENAGKLGKGKKNTAKLLAGPEVEHYHQAVAVVVAETFEQARAAASLVKVDYAKVTGVYDLEAAKNAPRSRTTRTSRTPRSATSSRASPARRSSWTPPTRRPTSRTR
jgi:xanthine dehydrogenase YagR molybdenum-binding subunit